MNEKSKQERDTPPDKVSFLLSFLLVYFIQLATRFLKFHVNARFAVNLTTKEVQKNRGTITYTIKIIKTPRTGRY